MTPRTSWRPAVDIAPLEREGRIALGGAAAAFAAWLLAGAGGFIAIPLEVLLLLAGVDLVVTGALGRRPLYRRLGYVPPSLRGRR